MNGHVTKPIEPDQLFATLQQWIKPIEERVEAKPPQVPAEPPEWDQNTQAQDELPATLPGFDLSSGLKRLQGNTRLYRKLLLTFARDYADAADDIRAAWDAEDFEQTHSLVHNLKGLAGNLAAEKLQAAALALEKRVKEAGKNMPSKEALNLEFAALEDALNQALVSARCLGASPEENACPLSEKELADVPHEMRGALAQRIRDAAEMGDVTAIKAIAEEIKMHSDACLPLSVRLVQLAGDFDFDVILALADELEAN